MLCLRPVWQVSCLPSWPGQRVEQRLWCFLSMSPAYSSTLYGFVFGRSAVVTQRNGNLFLLFRVGNVRSSHLLESHVRAQLIQKVVTEEGENIFFHQHELKVKKSLKDRSKLFISCIGWYSARWWGGQSLAAVAGHCRPPVSSS